MKAAVFAVLLSFFSLSYAIEASVHKTNAPPATSSSKINLNKADAATLAHSYKGIGLKRAEAIVSYRESHGAFKSVEELALVRGLGKAFVSRNLEQLQAVFSLK